MSIIAIVRLAFAIGSVAVGVLLSIDALIWLFNDTLPATLSASSLLGIAIWVTVLALDSSFRAHREIEMLEAREVPKKESLG